MIHGIGIDLSSIKRIKKLLDKFGAKFAKKILSPAEFKIFEEFVLNPDSQRNKFSAKADCAKEKIFSIRSKENFLAKRFAAKEAFSKAIGLGIGRGINFSDIEIANNSLGKPHIEIINGKLEFLKNLLESDNFVIHLSFSDEVLTVAAVVVVEK